MNSLDASISTFDVDKRFSIEIPERSIWRRADLLGEGGINIFTDDSKTERGCVSCRGACNRHECLRVLNPKNYLIFVICANSCVCIKESGHLLSFLSAKNTLYR